MQLPRLATIALALAGAAPAAAAELEVRGAAGPLWSQNFASPGDDWVNDLVPLANGNVVSVGFLGREDDAPAADQELDRLTARERDVLRLIARGYTYKEVAAELFISGKTVETHVSSVLRKLQLSNRRELSRWAADRRLV